LKQVYNSVGKWIFLRKSGKGGGWTEMAIRIANESNTPATNEDKENGWAPGLKTYPIIDLLFCSPFKIQQYNQHPFRLNGPALEKAKNIIKQQHRECEEGMDENMEQQDMEEGRQEAEDGDMEESITQYMEESEV